MNCKDVKEILERMVFEDIPTDAALKQHIASCPSCSKAYRDVLKAREVMGMVRSSVPVLKDPDEIADKIMIAIQQGPKKEAFVPLFLQRLLAAASVTLFLLFAYEQYGVVKKVTVLETKLSQTRVESRYSNPQLLASAYDINRAGISLTGISRIIAPAKGTRLQPLSPVGNK